MLLIECPWCGPRSETEFSYGGEAGITRPSDPDALSDAEWADYLFYRANPRGAHRELWNHAQGCRRWFGVERDTVTYQITRSFEPSTNGTPTTGSIGTPTDSTNGTPTGDGANGTPTTTDGTPTAIGERTPSASEDGGDGTPTDGDGRTVHDATPTGNTGGTLGRSTRQDREP